jgi:predicted O-methyltransferase YrrM
MHSLFPVAIPPTEGEALGSWVAREGAIRTIEVGLGYGISALCICEALSRRADPDARHVAIDPYQGTRFSNVALQVLEDAGVRDLAEFHAAESQIALPKLISEGRTFDFAFVDGNHRFDGIFVDFAFLARLVRPGGIVFLDDYQLPAIKKAASFFATNLGWSIEEISAPDDLHRWAVLRTSRQPDIRPYDWFVEF